MTFDPFHFKSQFPLFTQPENLSLVYLDNAATTQKPQCVMTAINDFYLTCNGNAQRASHRLARAATAVVEQAREQAAEFLGASRPEEVIFTQGATEALNMVAVGVADRCDAGQQVVVSHIEHHANLLPWQRLAQARQCQLRFFPEEHGLPQWQRWQDVINEKTRVLAISAASNVLGIVTDLSIIAAIKQQYPDIIVVIDASQLACHQPLMADAWWCDFLVCSAHKFYGPTGVGLLYGREPRLQTLTPMVVGGEMVDTVEHHQSTFVNTVHRLEAGTSSMAAIAGLQACLTFWQQHNRQAMAVYEYELLVYLHQQLQQQVSSHLHVLTTPEHNVGIATVIPKTDASMTDLADYLDQQNIAVRVGHHCAQLLWQSVQVHYQAARGLRVSLAAYNTHHDIDQLVQAINAYFELTEKHAVPPRIAIAETFDDVQWETLTNMAWQQRYKTLLRWGSRITRKPDLRHPHYMVKGCEAQVWLRHTKQDEHCYFELDSDSNVIKGLAVLLLVWANGKTPQEISTIDFEVRYRQMGFDKYLSQSRVNGFKALLTALKHAVNQPS